MLKILVALLAAGALAACSNSGGDSNPPSRSVTPPTSSLPVSLPDHSGDVESVQGQNPKRFYIANLQALNAIDSDADGIWDDIQALLDNNPRLATVDPRAVRLLAMGYQDKLLYKTVAEAQADNPGRIGHAFACIGATATPGLEVETLRLATDEVSRAVFTSKARVMASLYADGLSSGRVYSQPLRSLESCSK